uniref:SC35-like splicing factor family protein n=1 Tax=Rhizophora mucronata TaxID=61149 RepID=A0A2P2Q9P0_RHIMU
MILMEFSSAFFFLAAFYLPPSSSTYTFVSFSSSYLILLSMKLNEFEAFFCLTSQCNRSAFPLANSKHKLKVSSHLATKLALLCRSLP